MPQFLLAYSRDVFLKQFTRTSTLWYITSAKCRTDINGLLDRQRITNVALREQLSDVEFLSEELIDRTLSTFLQQVEDTDYSVSKLAVNAYTRLMARKLSERPEGQKIYVNCYCPGWVKTALTGFAGNNTVKEGADTGVWLALLHDQTVKGSFFAERREINF